MNFLTTRDQSVFPNVQNSHTESTIATATNGTTSASTESYASYADGVSIQGFNATAFQSQNNGTAGDAYSAGTFGFTSYQDATMQSFSQFSSFEASNSDGKLSTTTSTASFSSSSTSFSSPQTFAYGVSSVASYTSSLTTTSNVATTASFWTVTGSGSNASLLTTSLAVTLASNQDSDGWITTSLAGTSIDFSYSSGTAANYIEYGTIVIPENEWVWSVINSATPGYSLVSAFAVSFTAQTFWPLATTLARSIGMADVTTGTFSFPDATTSFPFEFLFSSDTTATTITSGGLFSRETITTSVPVWTTSSDAATFGEYGGTVSALSTFSVPLLTSLAELFTVTTTFPYGYNNASTTTLASYSTRWGTTSSYSTYGGYVPSFSSSAPGQTTEGGDTIVATDVSYIRIFLDLATNAANGINPVAPYGAFVAPSDLRSDGNPYNFARNLDFGTTRIPYPALASVFTNALVPFPSTASTTGTDGHTFLFSWVSDTLKFTEQSTRTSGTRTVTDKTVSSGVFSSASTFPSFYTDGGPVFGGFPAIPTAAETVVFPLRAAAGTSIDTDGVSSTYESFFTSTATAEINGAVVVESAIPGYFVWSFLASAYTLDRTLVFPRN